MNKKIKTKSTIWLLGKREMSTFKSHTIYRLALTVIKRNILIPIKTIELKTEKPAKDIILALNWQLHPVKNIWFAHTNYYRTNTSKPFIGKTDERISEFMLTRQRSYIESFFPQLIVKGKIIQENDQKVIVVKFLPGLYTLLVLMAFIIMTGYLFFEAIFLHSGIKISELIAVGFIILPMFTILTIYLEFDKTKSKIIKLLE